MKEPIIILDDPSMGYKKVTWDGAYFLSESSPVEPALSLNEYTENDLQEATEYLNKGFCPAMYISHASEYYIDDEGDVCSIFYFWGWGGLSCRLDRY